MKLIHLIFAALPLFAQAQPQSHQIFNADGTPADWNEMVSTLTEQQVVLFGELHNNAISHWLQLELTHALYETKTTNLVLGAEMFESDNQLLINEYFENHIAKKSFEDEARLWNNYQTDYKPLLEFANSKNIAMIATNVPRRYASLVNKKGLEALDSLSQNAKTFLAPLPIPFDIELPGYANMVKMGAHMPGKKTNPENLAKAQALKDATMGHFIVQNLKPNTLFLHFNGSYHSDNYEGISWYIKQYASETKIKTITTVVQKDVGSLNDGHKNKADYIIVVNERVTNTY